MTSKNQQGKQTHWSKQEKHHPWQSWFLHEREKSNFIEVLQSSPTGNYKGQQLMPDGSHTLCHLSMLRKPERMSMLTQLSFWDGLPPPIATQVQLLLFWPQWHFSSQREQEVSINCITQIFYLGTHSNSLWITFMHHPLKNITTSVGNRGMD